MSFTLTLCAQCYTKGYCRRLKSKMVSESELRNSDFVRDVRNYAFRLGFSRDSWLDRLTDMYRDYEGIIVDGNDQEALFDLEQAFDKASSRDWFRDFACTPCLSNTKPRVRIEAMPRVQILASILRAVDPVGTALWGVRPANDAHTPVWTDAQARIASNPAYPPHGCPCRKKKNILSLTRTMGDKLS